jgi:cysteine desulfuration protein SufE
MNVNESFVFPKEEFLVQRFMLFDDLHERIEAIISFGRHWPSLPAALCNTDNRILECTSRVWAHGQIVNGHFRVRGEAELPLIRGLASLIFAVYDGLAARELPPDETAILRKVDIWAHLSIARQAGVLGIEKKIRRDFGAAHRDACSRLDQ